MALTDSLGQGIPYATQTDKPNAQTLAKGIVDAVAPKVIMSFASASVRGATIATPVAGMVSWLKDVQRLDLFDGDTWVAFGLGTTRWEDVDVLSPWSSPEVGSANDDLNNLNGKLQYRVVNVYGAATVALRGAIGRTTGATYNTPASFNVTDTPLPDTARPVARRTFNVACSDHNSTRLSLKCDLEPSGHLVMYGLESGIRPPWISFNSVSVAL